MKRFLMLVGVAAVAAAMYVAARRRVSSREGPTAKQFNALKKQVATPEQEAQGDSTNEADGHRPRRRC